MSRSHHVRMTTGPLAAAARTLASHVEAPARCCPTASLGECGGGAEGPPRRHRPRPAIDHVDSVNVEASVRRSPFATRKRLDAIAATAVDEVLNESMLIQL